MLLAEDQRDIKEFSRKYYWRGEAGTKKAESQANRRYWEAIHRRTERMLRILDDIGEPSISNIGRKGAVAVSVLATHDAPNALQPVLKKFEQIYADNKNDCHFQSIPAMTDLLLILNKKPQRFGTRWLFDKNKWPWLPTVEDFAHVNQRRAAYGLEPLCWPKSLAIPEVEQPWLKRPFSEMTMRDPAPEEWRELFEYYEND